MYIPYKNKQANPSNPQAVDTIDCHDIQADVLATDLSENDKIPSLKQLKTETKIPTKAINALAEQLKNATAAASDAVQRVSAVTGGIDLTQLMADVEMLKTTVQTISQNKEEQIECTTSLSTAFDIPMFDALIGTTNNVAENQKSIYNANCYIQRDTSNNMILHVIATDMNKEFVVQLTPVESTMITLTESCYKLSDIYNAFAVMPRVLDKLKADETLQSMSNFAENAKNLRSVFMSDFDTGIYSDTKGIFVPVKTITNWEYAFSGCTALESIYINTLNTEFLQNPKCMFYNCTHLSTVKSSLRRNTSGNDADVSGNANCMFANCVSLKYINIHVKANSDISYMFDACSNLENIGGEIDLNNVQTEGMFRECTSLSYITINFKNNNDAVIDNASLMFLRCTHLPRFTQKLNCVNVESMFCDCHRLTEVALPISENTVYAYNCFSNCYSLCKIEATPFDASSLKSAMDMFSQCKSLTVAPPIRFVQPNCACASIFSNCTSLVDASDVEFVNCCSVEDAFGNCISLTKPPRVLSLDSVCSLGGLFTNCKSLPKVFPTIIDLSSASCDDEDFENLDYTNYIYGDYKNNGIDAKTFAGTPVIDVTIKIAQEYREKITSQLLKGDDSMTIHFVDID